MLTSTSSLLLALVALYLLIQSGVNYRTLSTACDRKSVATVLNLFNGTVAIFCIVYFGWRATRISVSSLSD